jgi:hypothetical protein
MGNCVSELAFVVVPRRRELGARSVRGGTLVLSTLRERAYSLQLPEEVRIPFERICTVAFGLGLRLPIGI